MNNLHHYYRPHNTHHRKLQHNQWDIIIGDTCDPVGPAETLFQPSFYESMYRALAYGGIVCMQA